MSIRKGDQRGEQRTKTPSPDTILCLGGMAERLKASVLKTEVRKYREFESHSLRYLEVIADSGLLTPAARPLPTMGCMGLGVS